jgi:hypothetical protein
VDTVEITAPPSATIGDREICNAPAQHREALCQNINSHQVRNSRPLSARAVRTERRA